jgi:hypothetical protein
MEFNKKLHECIFLSDCDFYIRYIAYSSQNCGTKKCRKRICNETDYLYPHFNENKLKTWIILSRDNYSDYS